MHLIGIIAIIYVIYHLIKEACAPTITVEQWANKELYKQDQLNGMSEKELERNLRKGRYYIPNEIFDAYPTPHREPDGKHRLNIENCELHREEVKKYGAIQVHQWAEQGKYNLNTKELEYTHAQFEKKNLELYELTCGKDPERQARIAELETYLASTPWDYKNTEAVQQWQKARDAEMRYRQSRIQNREYKSVAHFEAAGFTNIEVIDLDDAGIVFFEFWRGRYAFAWWRCNFQRIGLFLTVYKSNYFISLTLTKENVFVEQLSEIVAT